MKKLYIEPSVRVHNLKVESNFLAGSPGDKIPSSGIMKYIDESDVDYQTVPGTLNADYDLPDKPREGFIEGN